MSTLSLTPHRVLPGTGPTRSLVLDPDRRARRVRGWSTFGAFLVLYIVVGRALQVAGIVFPDAVSRTANAFYVLFSRYPHLPAMGFVWNPLPSMAQLPFLALRGVVPGMTTSGLAGLIESAACMAATVVALGSCLRKLGVGKRLRGVLLALFGLQPMVLLYAGSGQSEPMLLLFLTLTVSALISWISLQQVGALAAAGVCLGLAYLTRYEAVAAGLVVAVAVAGVTLFRTRGPWRDRARLAVIDAVVVASPQVFAVAVWAASSKILVGSWFPTFSSGYGNSFQVNGQAANIAAATGHGLADTLAYIARQLAALAPFGLPIVVAALIVAHRRRQLEALVALIVFGSVLGFAAAVLVSGTSFGWLRFQFSVVPLTLLAAGVLLARPSGAAGASRGVGGRIVATVVLLALAAAIPVQAVVLTTPSWNLAREEAPMLAAVFRAGLPGADPSRVDPFRVDRRIAADLDAMALPDGAVLTDAAYSFAVITASSHPHSFVITPDLDFAAAVARPTAHGVRYLLVRSSAPADAVQSAWPQLYATGAGIATLARTWDAALGQWRLYQLP